MTEFALRDDYKNKHSDYCPPFSEYCDVRVMAAGVAKTFTVPANKTRVFFQITPSGATFWADPLKAAVIPIGDLSNGAAPEMNPEGRTVTPGDSISVITSVAGAIIEAVYFE